MTVIACDVGGTRIKIGLVRYARLLARTEIPAHAERGLASALERIAAALPKLRREAGIKAASVTGFGLAFPGIIEPETERILSTPAGKFDDATILSAHAVVDRLLGLPLLICNDANAALMGEWRYGAAQGARSVVMMTLGTGVGTSAIIDGVPLRGPHGQAGCLGGHFVANIEGSRCRCGNIGCVEAEASSWTLAEQAQADPAFGRSALAQQANLDYAKLFSLAAHGDKLATKLRDRSIRVWAGAAVSLVHAYDPERLVLGGGVMSSSETVLPVIRDYVLHHAWTPWGEVEVVPAGLGNDAGLLGIAHLASERFRNLEPRGRRPHHHTQRAAL